MTAYPKRAEPKHADSNQVEPKQAQVGWQLMGGTKMGVSTEFPRWLWLSTKIMAGRLWHKDKASTVMTLRGKFGSKPKKNCGEAGWTSMQG